MKINYTKTIEIKFQIYIMKMNDYDYFKSKRTICIFIRKSYGIQYPPSFKFGYCFLNQEISIQLKFYYLTKG